MKPRRPSIQQPKLRSEAAQAAWNRKGGAHGGSAKQKNRRDRRDSKQSLRRGE